MGTWRLNTSQASTGSVSSRLGKRGLLLVALAQLAFKCTFMKVTAAPFTLS